jgi:hypothetical protein
MSLNTLLRGLHQKPALHQNLLSMLTFGSTWLSEPKVALSDRFYSGRDSEPKMILHKNRRAVRGSRVTGATLHPSSAPPFYGPGLGYAPAHASTVSRRLKHSYLFCGMV